MILLKEISLDDGLRLVTTDGRVLDLKKFDFPKGDIKSVEDSLQATIDSFTEEKSMRIHVYSLDPLHYQTIYGQYIPKDWWLGPRRDIR